MKFLVLPGIKHNKSVSPLPQAIVWDEYLTGPFGLIAQYSLLKVNKLFGFHLEINNSKL